jgi:hypothetical protein
LCKPVSNTVFSPEGQTHVSQKTHFNERSGRKTDRQIRFSQRSADNPTMAEIQGSRSRFMPQTERISPRLHSPSPP